MSPIILKDGDVPWLAAGASGGRRILAAVAQMMSFVTDFGMTVEQAAHQPRIDVSDPDGVSVDPRMPADVVAALIQDGPAQLLEHGVVPINYACPNLIVRDASGTVTGISDAASPWSMAIAQA
jgi:gamma-glutamyltranspeptidase/glutathione hydrolase